MAGKICGNAKQYMDGLAELLQRVDPGPIDTLADAIYDAWEADRLVLVYGNGGSAYTASHFVTDLVKTAEVYGQRRVRAISLCDNYGLTTALGNDISYDETFVYPLRSYARPGDLAIAVSCSGNSPNVVNACGWAKSNGLRLACLTGFAGGKIGDMADIHVNIPSDNYGLIEDLHLSVNHMIAQAHKARVAQQAGVEV